MLSSGIPPAFASNRLVSNPSGSPYKAKAESRLPTPSVRFGEKKDLEQKDVQETQNLQEAKLVGLFEELSQPMLTTNNKSYTGVQLLEAARDVAEVEEEFQSGKILLGLLCLGIPFCFKSYRKDLAYYPEDPSYQLYRPRVTELLMTSASQNKSDLDNQVSNAFKKMEKLGLVYYIPETDKKWRITSQGRKFLRKFSKTGFPTFVNPYKVNETPTTKVDTETKVNTKADVKTSSPAEKAPPTTSRLAKLRVLLAMTADGQTGWRQLKRIHELQESKSASMLSFFSKKGVAQAEILKALNLSTQQGLAVLKSLDSQGLVKEIPKKGKESNWQVTADAIPFLKAGDPMETDVISAEDWQGVIQMEMEGLKKEKHLKETELSQVEAQYAKTSTNLTDMQQKLDTLEQEALSHYEEASTTTEKDRQTSLKQLASDKALEAKSLQEQIEHEKTAMAQLKVQLQGTKTLFDTWLNRNFKTIRQLAKLQAQLKTANMAKSLNHLAQEMKQSVPGEQRTEEECVNPVLGSLSSKLGHDLSDPSLLDDPAEKAVEAQADQSLREVLLEQQMESIRAKRDAKKQPGAQ